MGFRQVQRQGHASQATANNQNIKLERAHTMPCDGSPTVDKQALKGSRARMPCLRQRNKGKVGRVRPTFLLFATFANQPLKQLLALFCRRGVDGVGRGGYSSPPQLMAQTKRSQHRSLNKPNNR